MATRTAPHHPSRLAEDGEHLRMTALLLRASPAPSPRPLVRRSPPLGGCGERVGVRGRGGPANANVAVSAVPCPSPGSQARSDLSPQRAGRGSKDHVSIFTYSKSPGLLSMPTLGGEIQEA